MKCLCGCNKDIIVEGKPFYKYRKPPKYIKGHSNKGRPKSEEWRKNLSQSKKGTGMGKDNPMYGIPSPNTGKHPSIETIKKLSTALMGNKNCVGKLVRENNPNWKGGISFLPYCPKFNNRLKELIRQRDNYTCQLCNKSQEKEGRKLSVHHIHYDKENCNPDLIALCCGCNARVNWNREEYENFFMNKLNERKLLYWRI